MSEVDKEGVRWYYILRAGTASVRIGQRGIDRYSTGWITAEPMDDDPESQRVADLINGLPEGQDSGFLCGRDFNYDPPRCVREDWFRKRMADAKIVGFPEEYTLEYLSPPGEVYDPEANRESEELAARLGVTLEPW